MSIYLDHKSERYKKRCTKDKMGESRKGDSTVLIPGTGDKNYRFKSVDDIVRGALERAKKFEKPKGERAPPAKKSRKELQGANRTRARSNRHELKPANDQQRSLLAGAKGMQKAMLDRQLDSLMDRVFGDIVGAISYAKNNPIEKLEAVVQSLDHQLVGLVERYKLALPQVAVELARRNPDVDSDEIVSNAIEVLNEELAQILYILRVYSDSLAQRRDKEYGEELAVIEFFYQTLFTLFNNLDPVKDKQTSQPKIPMKSFKIGDVYLARFTGEGLATRPGARGPIGAHALQVPYEFIDVLALTLGLLAHEFEHNWFYDVDGLQEEKLLNLQNALQEAYTSGSFKLSQETIRVGEQEISAIDLIIKIMSDNLGEIDADAAAILAQGPSYVLNMLFNFPAMIMRHEPLDSTERLLRVDSEFSFAPLAAELQGQGKNTLIFAPHPPDYLRVLINSHAVSLLGFNDAALECKKLAAFAVGKKPRQIVWNDENGSKTQVKIPTVDLQAAGAIVMNSLINSKMVSMGNRSMRDLLNWTEKSQAKAEAVAEAIESGLSSLPENAGTIRATHVSAGVTMAYSNLLRTRKGLDPMETAKKVSLQAMSMIRQLCKTC